MRVMGDDKWYKLRAGKYTMNTWNGDSQLTYVAKLQNSAWTLAREVDGNGLHIIADSQPTLRAVMALAEGDSQRPL